MHFRVWHWKRVMVRRCEPGAFLIPPSTSKTSVVYPLQTMNRNTLNLDFFFSCFGQTFRSFPLQKDGNQPTNCLVWQDKCLMWFNWFRKTLWFGLKIHHFTTSNIQHATQDFLSGVSRGRASVKAHTVLASF